MATLTPAKHCKCQPYRIERVHVRSLCDSWPWSWALVDAHGARVLVADSVAELVDWAESRGRTVEVPT